MGGPWWLETHGKSISVRMVPDYGVDIVGLVIGGMSLRRFGESFQPLAIPDMLLTDMLLSDILLQPGLQEEEECGLRCYLY